MSVRRRLVPFLLALALGVSAAVLVACGGDDRRLPANEADALLTRIDQVRSAFESGSCTSASSAAEDLADDARRLPSTVDRKLRQRIREGADKLAEEVPEDCSETQTTDTTTTETLPETTTETTPTVTTPADTTDTQPTTPTDTTTTDTTTQPTDPSQTTPDGTGGVAPEDAEEGDG